MELRRAEAEVNGLRSTYGTLRRARIGGSEGGSGGSGSVAADDGVVVGDVLAEEYYATTADLPELVDLIERVRESRPPKVVEKDEDDEEDQATNSEGAAAAPNAMNAGQNGERQQQQQQHQQEGETAGAPATVLSAKEALDLLETLRNGVAAMESRMGKFRKRLEEKDPITNAPRYGPKSVARVTALLDTYDALVLGVGVAFGEDSAVAAGAEAGGTRIIVDGLRRAVAAEEERAKWAEAEAHAAMLNSAAHREQEQRRLEEERRQLEEAERQAKRREEAELHRRALEARRQREEDEARAAREAREADRAFVESVQPKGPEGVRAQLAVLREATNASSSEPAVHGAAVGALHTLFSQIVAHPEEVKFRRVRRDHPKFQQDIGRHPGGTEVLVAAGFRPETVDGVKCLFSKEPDIESDMDGWSDWFDLLKKTLEIIEEEMLK